MATEGRQSEEEVLKALHLLAVLELDQFLRDRPLDSSEQRPHVTRQERGSAQNNGTAGHLVNRTENLPQRVPAQGIVLLPQFEPCGNPTMAGGAHRAMVHE